MKNIKSFLASILSALILLEPLHALPVSASGASPFAISLPSSLGYISDSYSPSGRKSKKPDFILIQDLHVNRSVQFAISGILKNLKTQGLMPDHIAVEGDTGPVDIKAMQKYPDTSIRKAAADYLVQQGEMPGAMHYAVTAGEGGLFGIETEEYYQANLEMFRRSYKGRNDLRKEIKKIQSVLPKLKRDSASRQNALILEKDLAAVSLLIDNQIIPDELSPTLVQANDAAAHLKEVVSPDVAERVIEPLSASINFYALALLRDEEMFRNSLAVRELGRQKTSIVITGGFHSEAMAKHYKQKGFSYVVISPNIKRHTKVDEQLYVERLLGRHLTPEQVQTGQDYASMTMLAVMYRGVNRLFAGVTMSLAAFREKPLVTKLGAAAAASACVLSGGASCVGATATQIAERGSYNWAVENQFPKPSIMIDGVKVERVLDLTGPSGTEGRRLMLPITTGPTGSTYENPLADLSKYRYIEISVINPGVGASISPIRRVELSFSDPSVPEALTIPYDVQEEVAADGTHFVRMILPTRGLVDQFNGKPFSKITVKETNPTQDDRTIVIRYYRALPEAAQARPERASVAPVVFESAPRGLNPIRVVINSVAPVLQVAPAVQQTPTATPQVPESPVTTLPVATVVIPNVTPTSASLPLTPDILGTNGEISLTVTPINPRKPITNVSFGVTGAKPSKVSIDLKANTANGDLGTSVENVLGNGRGNASVRLRVPRDAAVLTMNSGTAPATFSRTIPAAGSAVGSTQGGQAPTPKIQTAPSKARSFAFWVRISAVVALAAGLSLMGPGTTEAAAATVSGAAQLTSAAATVAPSTSVLGFGVAALIALGLTLLTLNLTYAALKAAIAISDGVKERANIFQSLRNRLTQVNLRIRNAPMSVLFMIPIGYVVDAGVRNRMNEQLAVMRKSQGFVGLAA